MASDYIDWNNDASYVLQWIEESKGARWQYQRMIYRVDRAMLGKPWRNLYQEELYSNIEKIPDISSKEKANKKQCLEAPEGESFALRKAVNTRANQMAGGVDTYEYQINDPYMLIEDDTEDRLAAKCEQDYVENRLEMLAPTFSRDLTNYGMTAVKVNYLPCCDKNIVERINPKNCWWDTMYSTTGYERFRGYSRMIPWDELKELILKEGDEINTELEVPDKSIFNKNGKLDKHIKVGKKKIKTINDLEIYIEDMNKLATSPQLQGNLAEYWEYDHDLRGCYNLNWYRTYATDAKEQTNGGYHGNDVELTVIYDLTRHIEFKIINRRFVISANQKAFCRKLAFPIYNPITDEIKVRIDDFCLECPLKFQFEEWENRDKWHHPSSPVMAYLNVHDQLCAWRSKRDHVTKLLSILRIETNGADAKSLKGILNIMGVVLDDIQGDINTLNFEYSYEPIDSQIAYLENVIMEGLSAYSQFDALQTMGDRASAAESGMAIGAIAQGLATHQNAIMQLYADIARQCIANRVAYSDKQEFPVNNLGDYSSITIQEMALSAIVRVKPKLAKKVQERQLATNALTALGTLKDILPPEAIGYFIEQSMFGNVPRKMAANFVKEQGASQEEAQAAQLAAQNQANMLKQNQQMYENNPMPYEVTQAMQQMSPDQIDEAIAQLSAGQQGAAPQQDMAAMEATPAPEEEEVPPEEEYGNPEALEMREQPGAMTAGLEGMTSDMGSDMANPNANNML